MDLIREWDASVDGEVGVESSIEQEYNLQDVSVDWNVGEV